MCGIAGIYLKSDLPDAERVAAMARRLAHRGPDDTGVHIDGSLALAHTRLSIIDLSGGHQPLFAREGRLALVANGEIYNHVELRAELEAKGHRFATHSDCETILHAYAEYGLDCLQHLSGMYAFALYDRDAERLLLVRDRLGQKPLFFAELAGGVAYASEIKALLPCLPRPLTINPVGLAEYLQNQFSSGADTLLHGVTRLSSGEALVVERGAVTRRWRYWSALEVQTQAIAYDEAVKHFDGLMETVMREHMRADVPFGLFLSGGVDSTILLGLLSRYADEPIRTYSVGFPGSSVGDELEVAERLARHFGSRHTVLRPAAQAMLERLPHSVWAADELMRDFASLPTSLLAEEAGRELKVVFSGEGGDEAFAGYGRYRASALESGLKNLLAPGTGGFRTSGDFRGRWPSRVFGAALQRALPLARAPFVQAWRATPAAWSRLQRMQYTDLVTALPDNLMVKADRMLMSWGVEGRLPLLDHRVVEFGLSLPDALKVGGKQGKLFLKRWGARFVPGDHLSARKRGFKVPVGDWLRGDYLQRVARVMLDNEALQEWFRPEGVRLLLERQQRRGDVTKNVYALLQFALWHRMFVEGDGAMPPPRVDPVEFLESR